MMDFVICERPLAVSNINIFEIGSQINNICSSAAPRADFHDYGWLWDPLVALVTDRFIKTRRLFV